MIARLQFWLQGWPNKRRPRAAKMLGNLISDARFIASFEWCEISHQEAYHLHRLADRLVTPERFNEDDDWSKLWASLSAEIARVRLHRRSLPKQSKEG
jgi:hypothetical protein